MAPHRLLASFVAGLIAIAGCGDGGSSSGGSGQAGQSLSAGGASGASGMGGGAGLGGVVYGGGGFSVAGGAGGGPITCGGYFLQSDGSQTACEACGATQCCDEAMACESDDGCASCIAGKPTSVCNMIGSAEPVWDALSSCLAVAGVTGQSGPCVDVCTVTHVCNPVTNTGCADGMVCDVDTNGEPRCLTPGPAALCGACDPTTSTFCGGTLHCLATNLCGRFCCDDTDCGGGTGRCVSWPLGGGILGVCVEGSGAQTPACDAPQDAPSSGSCF